MGQRGFFDLDERQESLSLGDPLEVLEWTIPWEKW